MYGHAALFMLAAAWTLQVGGHVRVDIFYADASPRTKALVDLVGALVFLLPFALVLVLLSVPYVARSWEIFERSRESSGLPFVYLLKTLIPLFAVLMALQGVAQAIRAARVLVRAAGTKLSHGADPRRHHGGRSVRAADGGLSGRAHACRHLARLRGCRTSGGRDGPLAPWRAAAAHLRRHDQRCAAGDSAVHLHGRDARALAHRRRVAGNHGPAVRHAARRPRHLGRDRRRAAGGGKRRRRRHHGDHGPDRAADDAALRLRQAARGRHGRGDRDAGANLSARDGAGAARRPDQPFLSGCATGAGKFRAGFGFGRRPVRRRHRARFRAGRALYPLPDRRRDLFPRKLARDAARSRGAARLCARFAGSPPSWSRRSC